MGQNYARKEVREIAQQLEAQGWKIIRNRGNSHYRIYDPQGNYVCSMASTPARSGMSITKAALRKAGAKIK